MRRKTIEGACKICGKWATLTFEHVPPQAAFNDFKYAELQAEEVIKLVSEDNRMPWDTSGLKKVYKQGGTGGYFLCRACNNNFGIWYVKEYVKFVYTLHNILLENDIRKLNQLTLEIQQLKPLRIFKSILAMFCDINNDCFGDNELREFLINKRAVDFNKSRYRVFAYLWAGGYQRRNGLSGILTENGETTVVSEISSYPIGFVLSLNHPNTKPQRTFEITNMADFDYDEMTDMVFDLPVNQCQTPFPLDFRTQADIKNQIL